MSYDEQPDGDPHGECTAEIHRLEAELATLESQQSRDGEVIRKQDEEIARLTAERDAALVDAERYRWLRDSIWYVGPDDFYCGEGGDMNEYENHNCQADTLDTAIDTAMATQ